MAKPYLKSVTVRGANLFPIDMLRYDEAYPYSEEDSHRIARDFNSGAEELRDVELRTMNMPNVARWASFGWEVVRVERAV